MYNLSQFKIPHQSSETGMQYIELQKIWKLKFKNSWITKYFIMKKIFTLFMLISYISMNAQWVAATDENTLVALYPVELLKEPEYIKPFSLRVCIGFSSFK